MNMPRKQKKYHYIYKTKCIITGKYYYGMHSTNNLNDEYLGSGKRLWNSINYYGKENHTKEIIEFCDNRENLILKEIEYINENLLKDKLCMNLQLGGGGGFIDYNHMMKVSKAGNDKFLKNLEDPKYRKLFSEKVSLANKKSYLNGNRKKIHFYNWSGKTHSEETKKKLSETKKGKGTGVTNPVWGRKWMNKNKINKMVEPKEFNNYLEDGWVFGLYLDSRKKAKLKESFDKIKHLSGPSCVNRKWMNRNGVNKRVKTEDIEVFLENGWVFGCLFKK
jgi:hypothetical protein